jgi:hypothetical protein
MKTTPSIPSKDSLPKKEGPNRRKTKRVIISFPIEVSGFDEAGKLFRERAVTNDVSEHGCRFDLMRELKGGEVIAIQLGSRSGRRSEKSRPLLFEVAWVSPSVHGWTVGAFKLQPENFWHLVFPANKPISR